MTIVVTGGTGTRVVTFSGYITAVAIKAPNATATYGIEIFDADSFPLMGEAGMTGNTRIDRTFATSGANTINIVNATNGTYEIRLWHKDHAGSIVHAT